MRLHIHLPLDARLTVVFYLASKHLTEVRSEVVDKIKLLNEELLLIDSHLVEQKEKKSEVQEVVFRVCWSQKINNVVYLLYAVGKARGFCK